MNWKIRGRGHEATFFLPALVFLLLAASHVTAQTSTGAGAITTYAGSGLNVMCGAPSAFCPIGQSGFSGDGGPATSALLYSPTGIVVDAAGDLFIADTDNNRIREVTPDGVISTVAGNGQFGFSGDGGPAISAVLNRPSSVAVDTNGNLFIADSGNNRIREVTPPGVIYTIAGDGAAGPCLGIVSPTCVPFSGDGGPATSAQLNSPDGVAVDAAGNVFVADSGNNRIRKVAPDGMISTIAGNGTLSFSGDGGPAISASLNTPVSVALDAVGDLFITDKGNARIREVTPDGVISTVTAGLFEPWAVTVDALGNLFVADTLNQVIRKVTSARVTAIVAGNGTSGAPSGDGGPATSAALSDPTGVAVNAAGDLFIADSGNNRIRKVTGVAASGVPAITSISPAWGAPGAIVSATITGTNLSGATAVTFSGDGVTVKIGTGGSATSLPITIAISSGATGGPDTVTVTTAIGESSDYSGFTVAHPPVFSIADNGGVSLVSSGTSQATSAAGYAEILPDTGSTVPAGLAIFGFRKNGVLISETSVPAAPLIQSGRMYAEMNGSVDTGIALANPNEQSATISFYFTDSSGNNSAGDETVIPANGKISAFLSESPFHGGASFTGSFTFSSSVPIAAVALQGLVNERSEFLMTTIPVADLGAPPTILQGVFAQFADGGGWTTEVVLVNPTDATQTGILQFYPQGAAATVTIGGQTNTSFSYSIPPRTSQKLQTADAATLVSTGWAQILPAGGTGMPSGVAIFSFRDSGVTETEAAVLASQPDAGFSLYAERAGNFPETGSIETGLAIVNNGCLLLLCGPATVTLELNNLDGSSTGLTGAISVPPNGQVSLFLNQIPGFASLPATFQGVLTASSSAPRISAIGLRVRYNERSDFLITTTSPTYKATAPSAAPLYFPHVVDSGGYTTQFVLYDGGPGEASSGIIELFSASGGPLNILLQ
jgi:NHL repeat